MGSSFSRQSSSVKCDSPGFYEGPDTTDGNHAQMLLDAQAFSERNPGTFESLHKMVREVQPNSFDGGKAVLHLPVGENAQLALNWVYSDARKNKFNPCINFASSTSVRAYERKTQGSFDFDFSKNVNFNLMHYFNKDTLFRTQVQSSEGKIESADAAFTYFGGRYSVSGSLATHSMAQSPMISVAHFLYRLNQNFDIGCEIASDFGALSNLNLKNMNIQPSFALKYTHGPKQFPPGQDSFLQLDVEKQGTFLGIFSLNHCQLFYKKHMAPGLQFLSSFMCNREGPPDQSSVASFGYLYSVPKLDLSVRSSFDTTSTIQTSVEKFFKNGEDGMGLTFCIAHNFGENRTFTGVGVTIGK